MTSATFVRKFAQKLGLFVTNSRQEDIANEISKIFLEEDDIETIRLEAYQRKVNHSLSGFTISSNTEDFSLAKNFNALLERGDFKKGIKLNSLRKLGEDEIYKGAYSYIRKKPARIELLQHEENSFDFYLKRTENGDWNVEIDSTRPTDLKELIDLFEPTLRRDQESLSTLDERFLSTKNSITFFDGLSKFGQSEGWNIDQISHVSIRRNQSDSEESIESEELEQNDLDGISQAIIEGRNLRENPFIENAISSGFNFSAMSYEFEHSKLPYRFEIRAEFKGRPKVFEVTIVKYYEIKGTEKIKNDYTLSSKEHFDLRSKFWNFSKSVFEGLKNKN
jgi:hypothetical protein